MKNRNEKIQENKDSKNKQLILIPKTEQYIQYIIEVIVKIPRTEKFNIGNEYKKSMYEMLKQILMLNKEQEDRLQILNKVDVELNLQRIYLRIMCKNKWIDTNKFNIAMGKIYEIGKILGGLIKYYGKNNKK